MLLELGAAAGIVALLGAVAGGYATWRYRRRHGSVPRGWQTDQSVAADLHRRLHRCVDHTRREIAHAAARGAVVDRLMTLAEDLEVQARGIDAQLVAASRLGGQARERALRDLRYRIIEVEKLADRVNELAAGLRGPELAAADAGIQGLKDRMDALDAARREAEAIGPEPAIELPELETPPKQQPKPKPKPGTA
jgi:hypothetical protein